MQNEGDATRPIVKRNLMMYKDRKEDNFKKNKRNFEKRDFDRKDFDNRDDFNRDNDNQPDKDIIFGRNSVSEAIKAERPLDSILVARGERTGSIPKILSDAQARRLKIRAGGKEKKYFPHTLNNTVVAPPRMLITFLENNLNEDGSVNIPVALRPYMGGKEKLIPTV